MNAEFVNRDESPARKTKYSESAKWSIVANYEVSGLVNRTEILGVIYNACGKQFSSGWLLDKIYEQGKLGRIQLEHFIAKQEERSRGRCVIPLDLDLEIVCLLAGSLQRISRVNLYPIQFRVREILPHAALERDLAVQDALKFYASKKAYIEEQMDSLCGRLRDSVRPAKMKELAPEVWGGEEYDAKEVYLVEGRADIDRLSKMGIKNVVCINGKALGDAMLDYLNSTGQIYTALFDGDRNGVELMSLIRARVRISYEVVVPKGTKVESLSYPALRHALDNRILL